MSEAGTAATPGSLHKTTIVIWSEFPGDQVELERIAREASSGDAYCSRYHSELVERPERDPAWDGNEFFDTGGER